MNKMKSYLFYLRFIIGFFIFFLVIIKSEAQINPINNADSSSFKYFKGTILIVKQRMN